MKVSKSQFVSCSAYLANHANKLADHVRLWQHLLGFIRDQKVPADLTDLFDDANVPFFEGEL